MGAKKIRINLQTDPWSRSTWPNGIGEGGPGRSKHSKKATGYTNQVTNMQRCMIKKLEIGGFVEKIDSEQALNPPPSPIFCFKRKRKNIGFVFFPGKAEVYDALLIKYGIGSAKDLVFSKY